MARHGLAWMATATGCMDPAGHGIWPKEATQRRTGTRRQGGSWPRLVGSCRYRRERAVVIMLQEGASRDSGQAIDGGERQRLQRRGCWLHQHVNVKPVTQLWVQAVWAARHNSFTAHPAVAPAQTLKSTIKSTITVLYSLRYLLNSWPKPKRKKN